MRYWVFTTKPGHFDMSAALIPGETLDWPTFSRFKFDVGDLVFFYASNPVCQLIGKLEIERNDLPFSEADPRNDLRKWPKTYSRIPWLHLRVLQVAPIPFKPLQRGSLYYHTDFKPSPYPKLLHEGEIDYVLDAFDLAAECRADATLSLDVLKAAIIDKVKNYDLLSKLSPYISGSHVTSVRFDKVSDCMYVTLALNDSGKNGLPANLTFTFSGIRRVDWESDIFDDTISAVRIEPEDIFISAYFDGSDLKILART